MYIQVSDARAAVSTVITRVSILDPKMHYKF